MQTFVKDAAIRPKDGWGFLKEEGVPDDAYDKIPEECVYVCPSKLPYVGKVGYNLLYSTYPDENGQSSFSGALYACEMEQVGHHANGVQFGYIHRDDLHKRDVRVFDPYKGWYIWHGDFKSVGASK